MYTLNAAEFMLQFELSTSSPSFEGIMLLSIYLSPLLDELPLSSMLSLSQDGPWQYFSGSFIYISNSCLELFWMPQICGWKITLIMVTLHLLFITIFLNLRHLL
ncbi:hypothetical protein SAY86_021873 [Trapa natans]|uniref:Uncharacterized protein n=1 Tax=Trapa natans TaxID=22666 RepID=A0AAN7MDC9_TRANT|nr:hypothetical protein SAY86_021873 [Trapa natans]